jgi:hypothetical protein
MMTTSITAGRRFRFQASGLAASYGMDSERRYGIIAEMTGQTVERGRASVAKYLEIPLERVQPESNLAELGLDSLGALGLARAQAF